MVFKVAPLSSGFMIVSILGFFISLIYIASLSLDWGIAFAIIFAVMFFASMISIARAPLRALESDKMLSRTVVGEITKKAEKEEKELYSQKKPKKNKKGEKMRYVGIIALLVLFIFIVGCGEKTTEQETTQIQQEEKVAPEVKEKPGIEEKKQMPKEVQELIAKADKLNSFQYQLNIKKGQIAFGEQDRYYVMGDKIKIKKFSVNSYVAGEFYDTVYVDVAKKTAVAYCEDTDDTRCPDPNKEMPISYNDVGLKKTPYQWIKQIDYAEVVGHEELEGRKVTVIQTPSGTKMWVNIYYGVPQKVVDGEYTYTFVDFVPNALSSKDLEHQYIMDTT